MKLKNILISGLGVLALTACNDYLDVKAPSSYTTDLVYSTTGTANYALNGVYAKMLSNNTFGGTLYGNLMLNSDVDFASNSNENDTYTNPRRFDVNANAGDLKKVWDDLYLTIESANMFIEGCSDLLASEDSMEVKQMVGEAKFMRAMCYSELTWYFGDVPFTFNSTSKREANGEADPFNPDIATREVIWETVINDLISAAEGMNNASSEGVERISKDAAHAMIARLALQAGGYYLTSQGTGYSMTRSSNYKKYYEIARDYAQKVKDTKTYHLESDYKDMFLKECNFETTSKEAIFELPFAKETSGNWGYNQGPAAAADDEGTSYGNWGKSGGSVRTTTFYRYMFDQDDLRRDFVCGMYQWQNVGTPAINWGYTMYNNKWSKLWNTIGLGATSQGNTGINFAYLRYADVLLMFAEADFGATGKVSQDAIDAVQEVRSRAFQNSAAGKLTPEQVAPENFLKTILDERKFEFAGENLRWKDLVRNNLYGQELYMTFLLYYSIGQNAGGSAPYMDIVNEYYGRLEDPTKSFENIFPDAVYSCYIKNVSGLLDSNPELKEHVGYIPNPGLYMRYVVNPFGQGLKPSANPDTYEATKDYAVTEKTVNPSSNTNTFSWTQTDISWYDEATGLPKKECLYSFYGYVRGNDRGDILLVDQSGAKAIDPMSLSLSQLPAVRYIMPFPRDIITRSNGKYSQKYGY